MAGTNSDYTEGKVVDAVCGTTTFTAAQRYLALFTVNPNFETGASGTEATGGSYARKAITFGAASGGSASHNADIQWTVGTDLAAATYTGWAVYDQLAAGGNMLFGDAFASNRTVAIAGDYIKFASGSVTYATT